MPRGRPRAQAGTPALCSRQEVDELVSALEAAGWASTPVPLHAGSAGGPASTGSTAAVTPRPIAGSAADARGPPAAAGLAAAASSSSSSCTRPVEAAALSDLVQVRRGDTNVSRGCKRGSVAVALAAAAEPASRQRALSELEADEFAMTSLAPRASLWRTWVRLHDVWFESEALAAVGTCVPVLPLSPVKISAVLSSLKQGGYRSAANYASRAKDEHIASGFPWNDLLERSKRRATASATRGMGPGRQSAALDLTKVAGLKLSVWEPLATGGPVNPRALIVAGSFFLTREIEAGNALLADCSFNIADRSVSWNLPASKTDVKALGKVRSWGCICTAAVSNPLCPFCVLSAHRSLLVSHFGSDGTCGPTMPLFPGIGGQHVSTASVVATIEAVAESTGERLVTECGSRRFGGHTLRVTGARLLASTGVDLLTLQILARWESDIILRYVAEAPL